MTEKIKDKDLENVNGGFSGDYDIKYEKENDWEPDEPTEPGTYKPGIVFNSLENYKKQ